MIYIKKSHKQTWQTYYSKVYRLKAF